MLRKRVFRNKLKYPIKTNNSFYFSSRIFFIEDLFILTQVIATLIL